MMAMMKYTETRRFSAIVRADMKEDSQAANVTPLRIIIGFHRDSIDIFATMVFSTGFTDTYVDCFSQTSAWAHWIHDGGRKEWQTWLANKGLVDEMQTIVINAWER